MTSLQGTIDRQSGPNNLKVVLPTRVRPHLGDLLREVELVWYEDLDGCLACIADAEVLWPDFHPESVRAALEAGRELRWVTTDVVGIDRWPIDLLRSRNLVVTNGTGLITNPIAEYVVMALLAGIKGFPELVRAQDRRLWLDDPPAFGQMDGKRALIYGFGSIGRAIRDRLRPFGVSVMGVRRHPGVEPGVVSPDGWDSHLPETDLLILSVPLTRQTRGLVGSSQLAALPRGAWVANVARGALIDQAALLGALRSGHLGGAYLDVTVPEPLPAESELWSLPNVILTPHSSWATDRFDAGAAGLFVQNLDRYRRGAPLQNVVDLEEGY